MRRTAESAAQTRSGIIAAACAIAQREGVLGLSVDKVLDAARVSKGGFFHHFATKQDLILAVVQAELDRFDAVVRSHCDAGADYPRALIETILRFLRTNATMMASVNAALAFGDDLRAVVSQRRSAWLAQLRRSVAPAARADLLAIAIDGVIFSCSVHPQGFTSGEIAKIRRALLLALEAA